MFIAPVWFRMLPLALFLLLSDHVVARSADYLSRKHHRPGLVEDLRIAWTGLLDNSAALIRTRDIENSNGSGMASGSGNVRCTINAINTAFLPSSSSGLSSGLAGSTTSGATASATGVTSPASSVPLVPSIWKIQKNHTGTSFFDEWDFNVGEDPTHGNVQFLDETTARAANLVSVNSAGNAIMAVDTTQTITGNRQSIRITTNYNFTGGLLVLDAVHSPTGCATWPAFWSNGPDWPNNGEIDIMEGVNDITVNQASIHTASGCHISDSESANNATGTLVGGSDCASAESNNGGCGQQATSLTNTYGPSFNSNDGGVYAMLWDESGVAVYFFTRSAIPNDLTGMTPQPQTWGAPFARWPATGCNPFQFFQQHSAIFDTTLCGDWAGNVWDVAGAPGQEQSCAQRTGFATCAEFVQNSGSSFQQAYWEVRSVRLYQKNV